jgi:nitroreductase
MGGGPDSPARHIERVVAAKRAGRALTHRPKEHGMVSTDAAHAGLQAADDFWTVITTQRSIREFEERPVPQALIMRLIEAATRAPSGSNLQPWRFLVIESAATRAAIATAVREHYDANERLKGTVEAAARSDDKTQRLIYRGAQGLFTRLDRAPTFIIPCLYQLPPSLDPNTLQAGSSIYQAVQNLLLAARALGLGTVMTTLQAAIEPHLRTLLAIPDDAKPVALIPVGYPVGRFGPTTRKPVEDVTFWERWSGA